MEAISVEHRFRAQQAWKKLPRCEERVHHESCGVNFVLLK